MEAREGCLATERYLFLVEGWNNSRTTNQRFSFQWVSTTAKLHFADEYQPLLSCYFTAVRLNFTREIYISIQSIIQRKYDPSLKKRLERVESPAKFCLRGATTSPSLLQRFCCESHKKAQTFGKWKCVNCRGLSSKLPALRGAPRMGRRAENAAE